MTTKSISDDIVSAFAGNQYPGDDLLTVYHPASKNVDETFQLLKGCKWQDMPVSQFILGDTPIPDLTPEAFHYYMPALLLRSLNNDVYADTDLVGSMAFYLSPSSARNLTGEFPYDNSDAYKRLMLLLSPNQRSAIIRVLQEHVKRGWLEECDIKQTVEFLDDSSKET